VAVVTATAQMRGIVTPEAVLLEFDTAGIPTRALARVLDAILVAMATSTLIGVVTATVPESLLPAAVILLSTLAIFGYPAVCETVWGATPGKSTLGLRVITTEGGPVAFRHAAIRAALQVVDLFLLPIGGVAVVSALSGRRNQRLGDRLAGTLVVRSASLSIRSRAMGFPPLPGYEGYAAGLDVGPLDAGRYEILRSFLTRVNELTPAARNHLAWRLAGSTAAVIGHTPPATMHPEIFLASVAAAYQQRHGGPATWMWGPIGRA
jgi:uncharacterized RDD family membrane protein YckC